MTVRLAGSHVRVLYDGWPLVYQPNSPAALHLLALLALGPEEVEMIVALPGESIHPLPGEANPLIHPARNTSASRLRWEQLTLPRLAKSSAADFVHLTAGGPALLGHLPTVVSPTAYSEGGLVETGDLLDRGWASHLRQAAVEGGLQRATLFLWPDDLPGPELSAPSRRLPEAVHPLFACAEDLYRAETDRIGILSDLNLTETYVFYQGSAAEPDLRRLLNAWSWAADAVGEQVPLLAVCPEGERLHRLAEEYGLVKAIRILPEQPLPELAALYLHCSALFHPAAVPVWGGPVRIALACGKPVVALESPRCSALVGPAAYLAAGSPGERLLGAALVSVIVDENLAGELSQAARRRASAWDSRAFTRGLEAAYRSL